MKMNKGAPLSMIILALMLCGVGFLTASLLGVGWRSTSMLEESNVDLRMAALDEAVTNWIGGILKPSISIQRALALSPAFAPEAGTATDTELLHLFTELLGESPELAAAYAGFADGRFVYVGRATLLPEAVRAELGMPGQAVLYARAIRGGAAAGGESATYFIGPDGGHTAARHPSSAFDPRTRRWFREAIAARGSIMTEPYALAVGDAFGVSIATPIGAQIGGQPGVIAFDFTLESLSQITTQHRLTADSIIMVATAAGNLLADSSDCTARGAACALADPEMHDLLRRELIDATRHAEGHLDVRRSVGGRDWEILVDPMPPIFTERFFVAAAVPAAEISAKSRALIVESAGIAVAAVLIAIVGVFVAARLLTVAIGQVVAKTNRIRNLDFTDRQPIGSSIREIRQLSESVEHMRDGFEVFSRYVAKDLVRQFMRSPAAAGVGGQRRDVTIMFSDIEGFSRISEAIAPELLTSRLSRYFDALAAPIALYQGTIDKFTGDGIMVFWNAPELDERHVEHACRAALHAAAASRRLASKWRERERSLFRTRFGLHTGPAVIGNVGARDRINYTLVGAVANLASRLEGLNKMYGTEILASGAVAEQTRTMFVWRQIDRIVPAGTSETIDLFELVAEMPDRSADSFPEPWDEAKLAYLRGDFGEAIARFEQAARQRPDDGPCRVMLERCRRLQEAPPPSDWDGVWRFDAK